MFINKENKKEPEKPKPVNVGLWRNEVKPYDTGRNRRRAPNRMAIDTDTPGRVDSIPFYKMAYDDPDFPHDRLGYYYKCRCVECRKAQKLYMRDYRAKRRKKFGTKMKPSGM